MFCSSSLVLNTTIFDDTLICQLIALLIMSFVIFFWLEIGYRLILGRHDGFNKKAPACTNCVSLGSN